jgi:putative peptidoglycan lipid II flippase
VKAALIAAAVNIAFKFLLMGPLAQVGLALATSIGAWINLGLVVWFAKRAGHFGVDEQLQKSTFKLAAAGLVLAGALWLCEAPVVHLFDSMNRLRGVATLALIVAIGGAVYGGIVLVLFGPAWLAAFRARRRG